MRIYVSFVVALLGVALDCRRGSAGLVVNWAMNSTPGGSGTTLAPDGQVASLTDLAPSITTSNFELQRPYNNLEFLLNIPFATLAKADVIAWEGNGGSAAVGGGWEATRFVLFDDRVSLTIDHSNDYRTMVEVRNNGVPLLEQAPKAPITLAIQGLADLLSGANAANATTSNEDQSSGSSSWLNFWPAKNAKAKTR